MENLRINFGAFHHLFRSIGFWSGDRYEMGSAIQCALKCHREPFQLIAGHYDSIVWKWGGFYIFRFSTGYYLLE